MKISLILISLSLAACAPNAVQYESRSYYQTSNNPTIYTPSCRPAFNPYRYRYAEENLKYHHPNGVGRAICIRY
jgi:hypothetical protein